MLRGHDNLVATANSPGPDGLTERQRKGGTIVRRDTFREDWEFGKRCLCEHNGGTALVMMEKTKMNYKEPGCRNVKVDNKIHEKKAKGEQPWGKFVKKQH